MITGYSLPSRMNMEAFLPPRNTSNAVSYTHLDVYKRQINAWPLDEAYVDYVAGAPEAGIINNTADYPAITPDLLQSLNQSGSEENVSLGYHAIEFLLWGQDLLSLIHI